VCPARYPTPPVIPSRPRRPPPVRVPSVTVTDPRTLLRDARLYLCTDSRTRQGNLSEFLDAVLGAGVDIIQLREKGLEARQEIQLLETFAEAAERHGKLFAVNDRVDIAAAVHAPILHLGQNDLPVTVARRILGDEPIVGRSTHTPGQFDTAAREPGTDYLCAGPIWATPTKPGRPATGLPFLTHADENPPQRPWFAIGGIENLDRLDEVITHGARRVVLVRAITTATDPAATTEAISNRLRRWDCPGNAVTDLADTSS
jgi:thiamine-phosphate pyrophosphorylase